MKMKLLNRKAMLQVIASVILFATILATSVPVEAKRRGTDSDVLLSQFEELDDDSYSRAFNADMRYNHMIAQGIDAIP